MIPTNSYTDWNQARPNQGQPYAKSVPDLQFPELFCYLGHLLSGAMLSVTLLTVKRTEGPEITDVGSLTQAPVPLTIPDSRLLQSLCLFPCYIFITFRIPRIALSIACFYPMNARGDGSSVKIIKVNKIATMPNTDPCPLFSYGVLCDC